MQSHTTQKRIWIGRWLICVAAIHTVAAGIFFDKILLGIVQHGVFDTVKEPMEGAAVWFVLFGACLALLGMAIHALEHSENFASARALGLGTLLLTILGVVLMPASGFWLAFPPAIGLLRIKSSVDLNQRLPNISSQSN